MFLFLVLRIPNIKWNLSKAELLQVGIFFLIHLFAWEILLLKKLEIEDNKTTYSTFKSWGLLRAL